MAPERKYSDVVKYGGSHSVFFVLADSPVIIGDDEVVPAMRSSPERRPRPLNVLQGLCENCKFHGASVPGSMWK